MATGYIPPRPVAPKTTAAKPAAKTTYTTPAVIAKPTVTKSSSVLPNGGYTTGQGVAKSALPVTPKTTVVPPKKTVVPKKTVKVEEPLATGGSRAKTVVSRTPRLDKNGKIIGWDIVYSDGTTDFESNPNYEEEVQGTTNVQVLKAILTSKGLPSDLVEESVPFLQTLLKEGIDAESAVSIYLNSKDFTTKGGSTITSPFYTKYGFYNAALTDKYDASTLFNTIEGYKSTQSKYSLNTKFISQDYIQKYLKNKISVAKFDENANTARLLAINADPVRVKTLVNLGFINSAQDLTDFYLDPNVGTEKMKQNVNTAAFAIEAIRRANTLSPFNKTTAEQYGAQFTAQGLTESQVTGIAAQGYESIARDLEPLVKTSGMYEIQAPGTQAGIQAELEAEQYKGLESERRKRLSEQYIRGLQGSSGITTQSLSTGSILGAV